MANVFTFIMDNLNNNKKASTKTTKTKPSTLSSKISINKNTTAQSIRDNLNKSSVTSPLETSTPTSKSNYVKQNVVDVKTNKVADNLNKSSVSDPLSTSYQPTTTKKTDNNTNTNTNKKVNNNSVSNPLENSYSQQEYTISDEQAKKDRQQIVRTASNIFTKALNTANENSWNEQDQHKLDVMYNAKVDTTSVDNKIKADSSYYNNLYDSNGNFIDYDDQILELEEKKKNTFYTQEIKNYDEQIKLLKTYQQDIETLKRSANYDYLVENGASQDQLNEYKKYVIRDDYNGIERAIANFGSTIQGYVGNSLKGADTLMVLANQLVGNDDYESSEYADKIIEQAGTLQQQVFSNSSSAEKVVYELYNSQANYLYALATAYMGGQLLSGMGSLLGATSTAQNLNSTALLLSDVSVLGSAMYNNEQMGYSKEDSLNNAILKACISHFTEKIGGDNIANIVTGKIGQKMLANGVEYMKKSIINSMISEGSEEFAEALLEPIADKLTTEKGMTVEDYLEQVCSTDTVYQVFMGAVGGGIAGGVFSANTLINFNAQVNEYASKLNIDSKADYNTAKEALAKFNELIEEGEAEIDKAKAEGQDTTLDDMQLVNCVALSKAYSKAIADYEQRNPYRDLVNKESDKSKAEFSQDAMKEIINDTRPDLDNALGTIDKLNQDVKEQQLKASTLITEEAINEVANEKQNNTDITQENITPAENENIVNPSVEMAENGSNDVLMDMQGNTENVGYHYGAKDLDFNRKSETISQKGSRGTGFFGTGTYFFGDKNEAKISGYDKKTEHKVDFSKYNLYKFKNYEDGKTFHDFFKEIENNYSKDAPKTIEEYNNGANELAERLYEKAKQPIESDELKLSEMMYKASGYNGEAQKAHQQMLEAQAREETEISQIKDELSRYFGESEIDEMVEESTKDGKLDFNLLADRITDYTNDYGKSSIKAKKTSYVEEAMNEKLPKVANLLGISEEELQNLINKYVDEVTEDYKNHNVRTDSLTTRIMKELGYEGIDVRGIKGLDNAMYGSVIYDLKPESVLDGSNNSQQIPNKEQQLDIIKNAKVRQPKTPYTKFVSIDNVDSIKTFEEAMSDNPQFDSDFTQEAAEKALKDNKVTIYSPTPIKQGALVTTSFQELQKNITYKAKYYSQDVNLNEVAWADTMKGIYANTEYDAKNNKIYDLSKTALNKLEDLKHSLQSYGVDTASDKKYLNEALKEAYQEIKDNGQLSEKTYSSLYSDLIDRARIKNSELYKDLDYGYSASEVRSYLKRNPLNWEEIKREAPKGEKYLARNIGTFVFKNNAPTYDVVIEEMRTMFPGLIDYNNIKSGYEFVEEVRNSLENMEDMEDGLSNYYLGEYGEPTEDRTFVSERIDELLADLVSYVNNGEVDTTIDTTQQVETQDDTDTSNVKLKKVLDFANDQMGEEKLTADELEQIIKQTNWNDKGVTDNQAQLEKIEKAKKVLTEQASKMIKGYDTLRAEFPILSKDVFNRAVYEVDIYGDLTDATANDVANELSLGLSIDGVAKGKSTVKEFVDEALETFTNEVKYKTGETNRARTRKAIKENIAYKSLDSDIEGTYNELAKGESLDKRSARIKKAYQLKYQSSVENLVKANEKLMTTKGKKIDSGVSVNKTIDQNIFALGHGDSKIYNDLKQKIRNECLNVAAETRENILNEAQEIINKVKKLGITAGTKEDIALQYILEGHTEKYRTDIDIKSKNINQETIDAYWKNPYQEYTLDDLKKEFDYKASNGKQMWENIVDASTIIREAYDNIIDRLNRTQIDANGDIEGAEDVKTIQLLVKVNEAYESMQKIKEEIKKNGSTPSTQAAYEIEKQRYNKLATQYNTRIARAESGELTRRNLTPYRKNYSHHIVKRNVIDRVKDIANAEYSIPTELAGVSDYTQPNTAFSSFSLAQKGGKYTPTALESFAEYMREASNVVAYNPVILELRQFNKDIKASTKGNTLNKLSEYLSDYCNMLAGKRNSLDKGFEKIIGTKAMKTISTLNQYAKQAAITGNFRSGLIQFANIPNGISILQSKGGKETISDIANGIKSYVLSTKDGEATAIDMSAYLANRYFDFDLGKKGLGTTVKEITDSILRIGDEVGSKIIWWSAYEQGKRLNVDNVSQYADDITRSATGGRTKEDMAITMNSQVVNLLLPFQLENNNVFQTLKQHAQDKNVGALATYGVSAYIFNMIIKFITGGDDEALAEFVTPIVEEIKNTIVGEKKLNEAVKDMFWGEIAEFISTIPGGDQVLQLAIDSDVGDEIFGEYNPSRYGSTNIGMAGIGKTFKALNNENPKVALANATSQLVGGYVPGGKQITRTIGGLQSMGGLPKLNSYGNVEISPTNYTSSGKVSWINDQSNVFDWIKATLFGKYNTSEARKYYDNGATPLGTKDTRIFETLGGEYEDYATVTNDDVSLREQLLASGQYDDYKKNVENLYADYLENWNEDADGDMKTWKEFAKMYGLSSDDLKQDVYDDFYESYNISEEAQKQFAEAIKIENVKDENGKTIANSGAVQRRIAYEQSGIYEQIIKYIKANDLEYSDFGLNKSVVENFDEDDINRVLAKIGKGEYKISTDDEKAKKGASKSAKSKSSKSSKTVVGSQISGSTSTTKSKTNYSTTNDYDNAYSSIMSSVKSGGKKNYGQSNSKSSGGSETTCPNCGSVVVPINGRCPRCGASL